MKISHRYWYSIPNVMMALFFYSIEDLKFISLFHKPFDSFRQSISDVFFRFQGIVKSNYRTVTDVSLYFFQNLFSCKFTVIIACYKVPHYNLIPFFQFGILLWTHISVRRSEQICVHHHSACLIGVVKI